MPAAPSSDRPTPFAVLLFNGENLALLRRAGADGTWRPTVSGTLGADGVATAQAALGAITGGRGTAVRVGGGSAFAVFFALIEDFALPPADAAAEWAWFSLEEMARLAAEPGRMAAELAAALPVARAAAIRIPYLNYRENDYIFRFRAERQRNRSVYQMDARAAGLYQSTLCEAIKRLKRTKERSSDSPAELDFGAVRYVLPSHFGFCLGVQNAIERAYESITENPGRRVFMLSELIHNPFVNEDLLARGLHYLQTDKGRPLADPATGRWWWETLARGDIVIVPAFGATDEDKRRLIERGIPLNQHDATCMLVEKVWKAARRYGQLGYTVIIHGKHEHEETKATFSNSAKYAPSLILRDCHEAQLLAAIILAATPEEARAKFAEHFAGRHTPDFDPVRDLDRLAVVNQTTLLRNETLRIIDALEQAFVGKYGPEALATHLCGESRGDTLCYATQVNQDALARALEQPLDAAIVVGGQNSSNTFQLFRLCEARFGERAFYVQSERNILSRTEVEHFVYPYHAGDPREGRVVRRPFLAAESSAPRRLLITGGASCPDGLIQQVVARVNSFFPPAELRSVEAVLADLETSST